MIDLSAPDPKLAPCRVTFDNLEIRPGLLLIECEARIEVDARGEWYIDGIRAINTGGDWELSTELCRWATATIEANADMVDRIACACAEAGRE